MFKIPLAGVQAVVQLTGAREGYLCGSKHEAQRDYLERMRTSSSQVEPGASPQPSFPPSGTPISGICDRCVGDLCAATFCYRYDEHASRARSQDGRSTTPNVDALIVQQAIQKLPTQKRIVFLLREMSGLTHLGIGRKLNLTIENSKCQLRKAHLEFRDNLR